MTKRAGFRFWVVFAIVALTLGGVIAKAARPGFAGVLESTLAAVGIAVVSGVVAFVFEAEEE